MGIDLSRPPQPHPRRRHDAGGRSDHRPWSASTPARRSCSCPTSFRHTFTLKELVRRGESVGPRRHGAGRGLDGADLARPPPARPARRVEPTTTSPIPIRRSARVYAATAAELDDLVARLTSACCGARCARANGRPDVRDRHRIRSCRLRPEATPRRRPSAGLGHDVIDLGTDSDASVDYPAFCAAVGRAVVRGDAERGIVIGGSGEGEQLAANKVRGIRAALCNDLYTARMSRQHNDANVLSHRRPDRGASGWPTRSSSSGSRPTYEGGRHQRRVDQLAALEDRFADPAPRTRTSTTRPWCRSRAEPPVGTAATPDNPVSRRRAADATRDRSASGAGPGSPSPEAP